MGVLQFAEDFTRLVIRHTRTPNNDLSPNATMPLNNEQIVFTIQHVLDALKIKGFENKNDNNPLEISIATNAIINPETSVNIKRELDTEDACRCSEDAQSVLTNDDSSVSDISLPVVKKERENSFNTLQNEKKFLSRSNPAIFINNISRSDTFVREENQNSTDQKNKDQEDVFQDIRNAEQHNDLNFLQITLNEIRKSTMNIIMKLNNLEQSFPQGFPNEAQQLSLISNYSSPRRISTINKTKVLSNTSSKSSSISSRTPTPSKMFPIENRNILERRKSTGGIRINVAFNGKSGPPVKVTETSNQNSQQTLNLSVSSKASPGSSTEVRPKFTKNPKYAHVKSTIPKAISQKKKM